MPPTTASIASPVMFSKPSSADAQPSRQKPRHRQDTTLTKLFVGNIPYKTTQETLYRTFRVYGNLLEAVIIHDHQSGRSKGYGFVTFASAEAAQCALEAGAPIIDGRPSNCSLASANEGSRKPRPARGSGSRRRQSSPELLTEHQGPLFHLPSQPGQPQFATTMGPLSTLQSQYYTTTGSLDPYMVYPMTMPVSYPAYQHYASLAPYYVPSPGYNGGYNGVTVPQPMPQPEHFEHPSAAVSAMQTDAASPHYVWYTVPNPQAHMISHVQPMGYMPAPQQLPMMAHPNSQHHQLQPLTPALLSAGANADSSQPTAPPTAATEATAATMTAEDQEAGSVLKAIAGSPTKSGEATQL
eukprot:m.218715 g.218715  ORF g.218715 m.218715 type:complete len:354 (-) comp17222_c0_seq1:3370-4431(-)